MTALSKSKVANFTERIKHCCPRLFPVAMTVMDLQKNEEYFKAIQDSFKLIHRS